MRGMLAGGTPSPTDMSPGGKRMGMEMLPSRHAIAQFTGGDPYQRTLGNYAKQVPTLTGSSPVFASQPTLLGK